MKRYLALFVLATLVACEQQITSPKLGEIPQFSGVFEGDTAWQPVSEALDDLWGAVNELGLSGEVSLHTAKALFQSLEPAYWAVWNEDGDGVQAALLHFELVLGDAEWVGAVSPARADELRELLAGVYRALVGEWEVLVSEVGSSTVRRISSDGLTASVFHSVPNPRGIAIEADGSVVVVQVTGELRRIAPDGSTSSVFFGGLHNASGVAVLPGGDLVVTEDSPSSRLMRVSADGNTSSVIAYPIRSEDVEVDVDGNIIVLHEGDGSLRRVTLSGVMTTIYTGLRSPADITIESNGSFVVAEYGVGRVTRISSDGSTATVLAAGLSSLEGVASLPGGDLLAAELYAGRLTKVASDGSSTSTFFEGLSGPDHIAVRMSGPLGPRH